MKSLIKYSMKSEETVQKRIAEKNREKAAENAAMAKGKFFDED